VSARSNGPVGLIQFDARSDTKDTHFGDNPYARGLPFSRAIEDRIFDPHRSVQMGLRGSIYTAGKHDCPREQGIRLIYIDEVAARGIASVMDEAIDLTDGRPTYLTFDIGSLDPFMTVGTRAPEIRVLTTGEAQFMLRRLSVVRIVGADVVEVAPPFDPGGLTALTRATMMFEILCAVAPGVAARW